MNRHRIGEARYHYSIADLLKYVTVCAVVMAAAPLTGVPAAVLLATFALALVTRQGLLAVFLFLSALIASQASTAMAPEDRQFAIPATLLMGLAVIVGYRLHRAWQDRRADLSEEGATTTDG